MKKYLKIGDFIIFAFVIIIIIMLFIFIFKDKYESSIVCISFKNEVIDEIDRNEIFDSNIETKYVIEYVKEDKKIYIYKNDTLFKEIINDDENSFRNVIVINNEGIKMAEASCKNKDCMRTIITKNSTLPIVCTNGIIIKLVDKDSKIDVI